MNWIKQNYEKFILLLVSLALLACSVVLILKALAFSETFEGISGQVAKSTDIKPIDDKMLVQTVALVETPASWNDYRDQSLYAAERHIIRDGQIVKPEGEMLHPPVPNEWIEEYKLDLYDNTILDQDVDGDGFTVLEEYTLGKTDPSSKDAHPPFWTKLRLKQYLERKFRIIFKSYTGDPSNPDSLTFQINTLDLKQPTQFLKLGDPIAGTKFKIDTFEHKVDMQPSGLEKDVSELTVEHIENGDKLVMVLERVTNSPDSFALFKNLLDGSEFAVKLQKTFSMKQDENAVFKLIDISTARAVIENTSSGEKHEIPPLQ